VRIIIHMWSSPNHIQINYAENEGPILINFIQEVDVLVFLLGPIIRVSTEPTILKRGFGLRKDVQCSYALRVVPLAPLS
jgi:hypothetical protein